jgi:adenylate kinase
VNLLLFGAPGSGKGTQAEFLKERYGIPQLSTGEIFRAEAARGTELGHRLDAIMKAGEYVPDELTIQIVRNRLQEADCANGCIFDGFPRTIPQAQALDRLMAELGRRFDRALYLQAPAEDLIVRLSGRLVCPRCGRTYNRLTNPPGPGDTCTADGTELIQRKDDTEEAARTRVDVYLKQTVPVIDYYRDKGLVSDIDALQPIDQVREQIQKAIEEYKAA